MVGDIPKILFLDDEVNFLEVIKLMLEGKGYDVEAVPTIERGLRMVKRKRYDIAIVDLKMPGMTDPEWGGMDFISTLIRIDPVIQIIALTGHGSQEVKLEAIDRGAFHFVEKREPILDNLTEAISYAYASKRSLFARKQMIDVPFGEMVSQFCEVSPYEQNVFIMMRYYEDIDIFNNIKKTIKDTLSEFGFRGHLAIDKDWSDDLWTNVRIYMHSCSYGLAVFEQIKDSDFNPNISLEVGYMYAMGKECLLLKDKPLPKLPTDICGKLYKEFDHEKLKTLGDRTKEWAQNRL